MADLSFLQQIPGTVEAINRAYEESRKPRGYLGLSQAGHGCKRYIWYLHKGYIGTQPEGRVLRLFQLGNLIEDQIIGDLNQAGIQVYHCQREVVFTQGDQRLVGHIDGIARGLIEAPETPHLLECKSASKKKFEELLKLNSYEKWNPQYGFQVQAYMLGLHLKRAAAVVYCKDDSRLYLERIKLRKEETVEKLNVIFEALAMPTEPARCCPRPDYYKAKYCDFYDRCFGLSKPVTSKRELDPWE